MKFKRGLPVIHLPYHVQQSHGGDIHHPDCRRGVVTRVTDAFIFVQLEGYEAPLACKEDQLVVPLDTPEVDDRKRAAINLARARYEDFDISFEEFPETQKRDTGLTVAAWIFVSDLDIQTEMEKDGPAYELKFFKSTQDAKDYRAARSIIGWIFAPDDHRRESILFPYFITVPQIKEHPITRDIPGVCV